MTLSRFVATPETRLALHAVRRLVAGIRKGRVHRTTNPLYLHGPPGSGKSHLAQGLIDAAIRAHAACTARLLVAADLTPAAEEPHSPFFSGDVLSCDLVILEDLQHLPPQAFSALAALHDFRISRNLPLVLTAHAGPAELPMPQRLASRLGSGLVVKLEALTPPSRRVVLEQMVQRRALRVSVEVIDWIAAHTPGGVRSLIGAFRNLEALTRSLPQPPDLPAVIAHWNQTTPDLAPTPERITRQVAEHFDLEPRMLRSRRRLAALLWPCQVAIYLTRELTALSWEKIGQAFGGRDPSTVRHAYQKVSERLSADAKFAAELKQLRTALQ